MHVNLTRTGTSKSLPYVPSLLNQNNSLPWLDIRTENYFRPHDWQTLVGFWSVHVNLTRTGTSKSLPYVPSLLNQNNSLPWLDIRTENYFRPHDWQTLVGFWSVHVNLTRTQSLFELKITFQNLVWLNRLGTYGMLVVCSAVLNSCHQLIDNRTSRTSTPNLQKFFPFGCRRNWPPPSHLCGWLIVTSVLACAGIPVANGPLV